MPLTPMTCALPDGRTVQGQGEELSQEISAVVYLSGDKTQKGKFCGVFADHCDASQVGQACEIDVLAWKPCPIYEPVLVMDRRGFQSALNEDPKSHIRNRKTMLCGSPRVETHLGEPNVVVECLEDFNTHLKDGEWERFSLCRILTADNKVWAVLQEVEISGT